VNNLKLGLLQLIVTDDPEVNWSRAYQLAVGLGQLDLLVFPELFLTGFKWEALEQIAEFIPGPTTQKLAQLAHKLQCNIVGGSLLEKASNGYFNTSLVFDRQGNLVATYRKVHLFPPFSEPSYLKGGETIVSVNLDFGQLGLAICYDLRFPELFRRLALDGVALVVLPAAFPRPKLSHWRHLLAARAIENQFFMVGVNQAGGDFFGHSMVVDPRGEVIQEAGEGAEAFQVEVDLEKVQKVQQEMPILKDRKPHLYKID
jgi:predicted amidohydrolase